MAVPHKSAWILDRAVRAIDMLADARDICYAAEELALGSPQEVRPLDLCVGLGIVEPQKPDNRRAAIVVGRGAVRVDGAKAPVGVVPASLGEVAFSIESLLEGGSTTYSDAYAFGAVFATKHTTTGEISSVGVRASILRGGTGLPLLVQRTMSASDALTMHNHGRMGNPEPSWNDWENNRAHLEIARFVLDIDRYEKDKPGRTAFKVLIRDTRRARGWGGHADDTLANTLLPETILSVSEITYAQESLASQMYKVVAEWADLSCWTPDFAAYWTEPENAVHMRPALEGYLNSELGYQL
jgi:hypothetical protein